MPRLFSGFPNLIFLGLSSLLLRAEAVTGKCYVITFSPSHNLTLADLDLPEIVNIIKIWTGFYTAHLSPLSPLARMAAPTTLPLMDHQSGIHLRPLAQYRYMQIFENKGAAMGCSNPHPHGQVWITSSLPEELALEFEQLKRYHLEQGGAHLLEDYAKLESDRQERVVFENAAFLALCPWWAIWPFEVMIVAKKHKRALVDLDDDESLSLAEAISEVTRRYDNLFETRFPYSMGLHQAPLEGTDAEMEASHFHIHFYPPLLRSATVRKFLVGSVKHMPCPNWYHGADLLWLVGMKCWQNLNETLLPNKLQQDYVAVEDHCIGIKRSEIHGFLFHLFLCFSATKAKCPPTFVT